MSYSWSDPFCPIFVPPSAQCLLPRFPPWHRACGQTNSFPPSAALCVLIQPRPHTPVCTLHKKAPAFPIIQLCTKFLYPRFPPLLPPCGKWAHFPFPLLCALNRAFPQLLVSLHKKPRFLSISLLLTKSLYPRLPFAHPPCGRRVHFPFTPFCALFWAGSPIAQFTAQKGLFVSLSVFNRAGPPVEIRSLPPACGQSARAFFRPPRTA